MTITALLRFFSAALLITGLCVPRAASAQGSLITSPGSGTIVKSTGNTQGAAFRVGALPLTITALGILDAGSPGLDGGHTVGLWTSGGALLTTASLSPGLNDFSSSGFVYRTLASPVVLQPSTVYVIGADYYADDIYYANGAGHFETWSPEVTFVIGRYSPNDSNFAFPSLSVGGLTAVGPNAQFQVPEPSSGILLIGATSLFVMRKKKRTHAV